MSGSLASTVPQVTDHIDIEVSPPSNLRYTIIIESMLINLRRLESLYQAPADNDAHDVHTDSDAAAVAGTTVPARVRTSQVSRRSMYRRSRSCPVGLKFNRWPSCMSAEKIMLVGGPRLVVWSIGWLVG